jgi:DNA-3-methyladenine glycosylase II
MTRIIATDADIAEALAYLCASEPRFATLVARNGHPPLRRAEGGLPGLYRIVVDQMISLKAGEAIWRRVERALAPFDPPSILRRRETTLMKLGLSRAKARSFRAIAEAVHDGTCPLDDLHRYTDEQAMAALCSITGIGPWTAEIYLLSCLGRGDVWPAGDVALQAAVHSAFELPARPTAKETIAMAEPWRPWRAVAARLLWSHYRELKGIPQPPS